MLDFGTRISSASEHDEDDLFAGISGENPERETDNIPERTAPEAETANPVPAVAPAAAIEPVKEPVPQQKKKEKTPLLSKMPLRKRCENDADNAGKLETARILKETRLQAGLTPEDVESETQIRVHFLVALEEGYFDDLPQQVYVLAYLRKLCNLYKIPKTEEEQLVLPWRQMQREVPDALPRSVIPDDDSMNSKVLHRLEVGFMAAGAIIIIGILTFLVIWGVSFLNKDKVVPHFDNKSLLELQEKPRLVAPSMAPVQRNR